MHAKEVTICLGNNTRQKDTPPDKISMTLNGHRVEPTHAKPEVCREQSGLTWSGTKLHAGNIIIFVHSELQYASFFSGTSLAVVIIVVFNLIRNRSIP